MEVREYISIRRAYNIVRQDYNTNQRLTFSEFAILCKLYETGRPLRTSDIAEYQGCLRPTMTHRTKHLGSIGFIDRLPGDVDRRNVVCALTDEGRSMADELCEKVRVELVRERSSSRITRDRVRRTVDVMGSLNYMARDLILVSLCSREEKSASIGELVSEIGFLQPTMSMSAAALVREELVIREKAKGASGSPRVVLTDAGEQLGEDHIKHIKAISVPRNRKK
jgi:DNA-binding MarR family transcriptional regulator